MRETMVILHNIRSAHNVGSIFRTADAAGVSRIYLTGYTSCPTDRFGRIQKEIAKTALGAERYIPWERHASVSTVISTLKRDGWGIVGVEQDARAKSFRMAQYSPRTVFVFGNEVRGLSKPLRDFCDILVHIPMRGKKESLNVSVTAGIILFLARSGAAMRAKRE